jgi:hypothetical protein
VFLQLTGIFDTNPARNPWAGANLVQIGYCSSDAWVGDVSAADATPLATTKNVAGGDGWAFKGQRIIEATLAALVSHYGLGAPTASGATSRLLFGGCSAGARGALFNADFLAPMLPASVELRVFLDSPLWVDIQPLNEGTVSLQTQTQSVFALVNATARLGAACAATFPGVEGWKCLFGQVRWAARMRAACVASSC